MDSVNTDPNISRKGIRFAFLPVQIRFLIRDLLLLVYKINIWFANYFIRPLKRNEAENLKEEIKLGSIKKILINRNDRIGDAVLSLKVIEQLKKVFNEVYVLYSKENQFILKEISGIKLISEREIENDSFDLLIDLNGSLANKKVKSKYKVGFNRGVFSIYYTNFYPYNITESKKQYIQAMIEMIDYCLNIKLNIDDLPPKDYKKEKKNQIFILVGNKPNRNLSYKKWKELILLLSNKNNKSKIIVADDPNQFIMTQLKVDSEILNQNNIQLITEPKSLKDLAKIANDSKFFIALDGGAEHYLERYTNSITLYTCGYEKNWRPFSLNMYKYTVKEDHVIGETTTSIGLKKIVLYRIPNRTTCYNLVCDYKQFKEIEFNQLFNIV